MAIPKVAPIISCLCLALLAAAPPLHAASDDWAMAFHDSRHTGQTSEVVTAPLTLKWTWQDTMPYDNNPQFHPTLHYWMPIFYRGLLCIQGGTNADRFFCLNPSDASQVWQQYTPGYTENGYALYQFDNYLAAVNGRILHASVDYTSSMDAATGQDAQWVYNTNGAYPYGGFAVWGNMGYEQFVRSDEYTEAFNIVQNPSSITGPGSVGWYFAPNNSTTFMDWSMRITAVDAGVVYYSVEGQLHARDARTGRFLWSWGQQNYNASPAVMNGIVYFYASSQNKLMALDTNHIVYSSGAPQIPLLWTAPIYAYSPIVSDGVVYSSSVDGFYALDAATGATKWTFPWTFGCSSFQMPAISGNTIFVPTKTGVLLALDKRTGAELWRYTGNSAFGPVVVANGMVFVSDQRRVLYAFTGQTAAIGPAVTSLSTSRVANGQASAITLTGSGFFGGGASSLVQKIQLDNPAGTQLLGYTASSDTTITGVTLPAGLAPGTYHIRVQTSIGMSVNEPSIEVVGASSFFQATLGLTNGDLYGTQVESQRHLVRTSNGNLIAVYAGTVTNSPDQDSTYNVSHDGGLTWTYQAAVHTAPWNDYVARYASTSSVWVDAQDHLNSTYVRWGGPGQSFETFSLNSVDLLTTDAGLPVITASGAAPSTGTGISQSNGRRWVVFVSGGQVNPRYSDDGQTWTTLPAVNSTTSNLAALVSRKDPPAILFNDGPTFSFSQWNGTQWSASQALPGPITGVRTFSAVATNDGRIHVAYTTGAGISYIVYSGTAWSTPVVLNATATSPSLTTNGTDLWCFYANASGDIVFQRTVTGSWIPSISVTSDGNYNTAPSTLALSPDSRIPVIWTSGPRNNIVVKSASIPLGAGGPAATNVSGQVKVSTTAYMYNRISKMTTTQMTITNTGSTTIYGPIETVLTNMSAGWTLLNPTGTNNGSPYLTVSAGPIAPGASVSVQLQINYTGTTAITFIPVTYSGSF